MLLKSTRMQIKSALCHKEAFITICILTLFIFLNFFTNVVTYTGKDVIDMYFPMKLLLLSSSSGAFGFYFMQYYPLLVILPAGFSYISDRDSREDIYIQSKVGIRQYYIGKIFAVFFVTFFVFTLPFLIEMLLSCIAFPIQATGDLSNVNIYEKVYINAVKKYYAYKLYAYNPYLYTMLFTLLFGLISGVLSVFINVISMCNIKFKILLFLPTYILLYGIGIIGQINSSLKISTSYFDYLRIFNNAEKSGTGYFIIIIVILMVSIILTLIKSRKDSL